MLTLMRTSGLQVRLIDSSHPVRGGPCCCSPKTEVTVAGAVSAPVETRSQGHRISEVWQAQPSLTSLPTAGGERIPLIFLTVIETFLGQMGRLAIRPGSNFLPHK